MIFKDREDYYDKNLILHRYERIEVPTDNLSVESYVNKIINTLTTKNDSEDINRLKKLDCIIKVNDKIYAEILPVLFVQEIHMYSNKYDNYTVLCVEGEQELPYAPYVISIQATKLEG